MNYTTKDREIIIKIPASNSGKFRFKTRSNNLKFGDTFSTRDNNFNENVYLEWQISYDATIADMVKGEKDTKLKSYTFVGANKKTKYLYELSELVYEGINNGLILIEDISSLLKEISNYKEFIDKKKIDVEYSSKIVINGIQFEETSIKLPTLFMIETTDNTQIEISIQKQQYASGVQPMVYFCIPIKSFQNYKTILGRPSKLGDELVYIINNKNASVLFDMIKIFAMCSQRHHFDIAEIIKILIKLAG
jgi:hypothetical protein